MVNLEGTDSYFLFYCIEEEKEILSAHPWVVS